ncbi:FkbM family methyltransferase [Maridesulfovibrio sp. FT414]|uniref:FkbM family methyltransferase n=1 Tax=Maridesulfovibrio sp. FT414 TaxID=2979469 RepID=UPI003D807DB3
MDIDAIEKFKVQVAGEILDVFGEVQELFDARDFYLEKIGDWYAVRFTQALGYRPVWKYEPLVRYSFQHKAWECKIGTARFLTSGCPFFELICELRGYTLAGTVPQDAVVLDAGPWNGISGMYFSAAARKGLVILLEPDNESADYLAGEIQMNHFSNTELVRKALYVRSGEVGFQHRDFGASSIASGSVMVVPSIGLRELAAKYAPGGIDFFKVDIEGAEVAVADDLARYISENKGSWAAIASYHKVDGVKSFIKLEKCFSRYPELVFKTVYPYHQTTFVANAENEDVARSIRKLTSFEIGWKAIQRDLRNRGGTD